MVRVRPVRRPLAEGGGSKNVFPISLLRVPFGKNTLPNFSFHTTGKNLWIFFF